MTFFNDPLNIYLHAEQTQHLPYITAELKKELVSNNAEMAKVAYGAVIVYGLAEGSDIKAHDAFATIGRDAYLGAKTVSSARFAIDILRYADKIPHEKIFDIWSQGIADQRKTNNSGKNFPEHYDQFCLTTAFGLNEKMSVYHPINMQQVIGHYYNRVQEPNNQFDVVDNLAHLLSLIGMCNEVIKQDTVNEDFLAEIVDLALVEALYTKDPFSRDVYDNIMDDLLAAKPVPVSKLTTQIASKAAKKDPKNDSAITLATRHALLYKFALENNDQSNEPAMQEIYDLNDLNHTLVSNIVLQTGDTALWSELTHNNLYVTMNENKKMSVASNTLILGDMLSKEPNEQKRLLNSSGGKAIMNRLLEELGTEKNEIISMSTDQKSEKLADVFIQKTAETYNKLKKKDDGPQ